MKKTVFCVLLSLISAFLLFSCAPGQETPDVPPAPPSAEKTYYKVMVSEDEGFTVESENPQQIESGKDAVFKISIDNSYVFSSVSEGTYNEETGELTIPNVSSKMNISFTVESLGYDTSVEYAYFFKGTQKDETSVLPGSVNAGSEIKLTAGDSRRIFVGWSFGKSAESGGEIVSKEREYSFRISPENVKNGALTVYSNYKDSNIFHYDLNGGVYNADTYNSKKNDFYSVEAEGNKVTVTLYEEYYSYAECASTFWNDGSFTREGYLLTEYNTKADGSGESYSLGSKYYPKADGDSSPTLYCIWKAAAPISDFSYSEILMPCPVESRFAPDWVSEGIVITEYLGNESSVAVPEKINEKTVISIGSGAFKNKSLTELILPRRLQKIEDGAFVGCSSLKTLYYPDGIYYVSDSIFDSQTYSSFKNLYVNATIAPRYASTEYGAFAVKLCRVLSREDEKLVLFIAGSSTYQGLGTEYIQALFGEEYRVVNYGTTRTRPCYLYMEALSHYTCEGDIVVYAPENSAYMLGENIINQNMTIDLEGVNNIYRYLDISKYTGYFTALGEMNRSVRYTRAPERYEIICRNTKADRFGDYQNEARKNYEYPSYTDAYYITLNERCKSIYEGTWSNVENQAANKDYTDKSNITWTSIDRPELLFMINSAISSVKSSGAQVYFAFAPVDADAVVAEARNADWLSAYDKLVSDIYDFDGILGSSANYIYNHKYFYNCAYHVNDYGRTYRTYRLYLDIAKVLGIEDIKGIYEEGTDFTGCEFEDGSEGLPVTGVDYLD